MNKNDWILQVDNYSSLLNKISAQLWDNPEISGEEKESAALFRQVLEEHGFAIKSIKDMPNAFIAEYGSGKPVISLLGEYDALPKMSQKCCPIKDEVVTNGAGHGCGHNLLGTAPLCAAIAARDMMKKNKMSGTIRFYGCPEEETLNGKVKMIHAGAFDGSDIALSWHPMAANKVVEKIFFANNSIKFKFTGIASHAGVAPHLGRSALDAVELTNVGANYLREHIIDRARLHYTTNSGNLLPNVVHPYADTWYYVRAPRRKDVSEITQRLINVAKGAQLMTGTTLEIEKISGCYEITGNPTLTRLTYKNMCEIGAPVYSSEEKEFAQKLQATISNSQLAEDLESLGLNTSQNTYLHASVCSMDIASRTQNAGSSDSGDVSQIMPMNFFTCVCWPLGCVSHTWQATASAGSTIGSKGALFASKIFCGLLFDLLTDSSLVDNAKKEFELQHLDEKYICPLG